MHPSGCVRMFQVHRLAGGSGAFVQWERGGVDLRTPTQNSGNILFESGISNVGLWGVQRIHGQEDNKPGMQSICSC